MFLSVGDAQGFHSQPEEATRPFTGNNIPAHLNRFAHPALIMNSEIAKSGRGRLSLRDVHLGMLAWGLPSGNVWVLLFRSPRLQTFTQELPPKDWRFITFT